MNRIRFSTLLYVVLLLALAACQPQAAPLPTATSLPPTAIPSAKAPTAIPSTPAPATATAIPQAKNPVLVEHTIPTSQTDPGGIVAGPDGALWFVETAANKIGRISTDGVVTEYSVPTAGAIDRDQGFIAIGPDGALWFNEDLVNKVGRITTTGQFTEYALPAEFAHNLGADLGAIPIRGLVTGPDGGLWVTSPSANAIAKLTTDGKVATKYTLPKPGTLPVGMVAGPDGALWFVEAGANQVGRMTLDGKLSEYALPAGSKPLRLVVGPDQAIWFTLFKVNKVGRINTDGKLTLFDAAGMGPVGIAAGSDGALWFTGYSSNEIGRMTTDGKLTKLQVPTASSVPYHIAAGPDGNLWFTEQQGNLIGEIKTSPSVHDPTTPKPAQVLAEWHLNMPEKMAFAANSVWVPSHRDPNVITRIDPTTNQIIATINGIGYQAHQALAVGDSIWVTGWGLKEIDTKTNAIVASINESEHHAYIAYGFDSLWATNKSDGLDRIDPRTSKIVASIVLGDGYVDCNNDVAVTSTAVWVVHCDEGELIKIDPTTNRIVARISVTRLVNEAKSSRDIPTGKGSDFLWGVIPGGLLRIDPNTGTGASFLPLSPEQIGDGFFSVTDKAIWIAGDGQIEKVNVATNQIEATYQTHDKGTAFVGIGFDSVWIGYENTGLVQRLDIAP